MKRTKPTKAELTAMNRGKAVTVYPAGSDRAQIRVAGKPSRGRARKR